MLRLRFIAAGVIKVRICVAPFLSLVALHLSLQESAANEVVADVGENGALSQIDDKNDAVVTINASGIIQLVNKVGY